MFTFHVIQFLKFRIGGENLDTKFQILGRFRRPSKSIVFTTTYAIECCKFSYDNFLRCNARDTNMRAITCNYQYKEH